MIKKKVILLLLALLPLMATAQEEELTVTVDSVGTLAQLLPDSIRYSHSSLKICGKINGNDLRILKMITSHLAVKKPSERLLTELDLSEAIYR